MRKQIKPVKSKTGVDNVLLKEIRTLIVTARNAVIRNINAVQVMTSYEIGLRFSSNLNSSIICSHDG